MASSFHTSQFTNMNLHVFHTDKFKTITIQLNMAFPLQEQTVTHVALLPYVLKRGSKEFPDEGALYAKLDELYGATLEVETQKRGETQVMAIRLEVVCEQYIQEDAGAFNEALELLKSILLAPAIEKEGFRHSVLEIEKENLRRRIDSIIDDKGQYANLRTSEELCEGEPYALSATGKKENIDMVTAQNLYQFYLDVLRHNPIDWYVIGDVDETEVKRMFQLLFGQLERGEPIRIPEAVDHQVNRPKEVTDQVEVVQGKLHLGYRTHTRLKDPDYFAMLVFNGVYGAFPHSKLFRNVREKESLAYYAWSRIESLKGLLIVNSGIEFENYEKAKTIMLEQLEQIRKGEIQEDELSQTKSMLINQMKEQNDSAGSLIQFHYQSQLGGVSMSIDEMNQKIDKVQKDEIVKAATKIELGLIYFLRNKEGASA